MGSREGVSAAKVPAVHHSIGWLNLLAAIFARSAVRETVVTRMHFRAGQQTVWDAIRFYEEIPIEPNFLLRLCIPCPLRSEGKKSVPGARVVCIYNGGDLIKQITAIEPPHRMLFEVHQQSLGIENCFVAQGGSYEIVPAGEIVPPRELIPPRPGTIPGVDVLLTTHYFAWLHPRWFFRPFERFMTHQLHRHILRGMMKNIGCWHCP